MKNLQIHHLQQKKTDIQEMNTHSTVQSLTFIWLDDVQGILEIAKCDNLHITHLLSVLSSNQQYQNSKGKVQFLLFLKWKKNHNTTLACIIMH